jgi:carbonic anhydrase
MDTSESSAAFIAVLSSILTDITFKWGKTIMTAKQLAGISHAHGLCDCRTPLISPLSRRGLLKTCLGAAIATTALGPVLPQRAAAQSTLSPAAALQALLDGNKRFVEQRMTSFNDDLTILRDKTVAKQQPFAAVLSCADSRVPVEVIFDQTIGHVFVNRVAGNLATSEMIASLEYGAAVLGTKAILVLGHSDCGAAKAAIDGKEVPGQISGLYAPLRPAVDAGGGELDAVVRDNAKIQAHLLATGSPLLAGMIKEGKLKIASGFYNLASGAVTVLS